MNDTIKAIDDLSEAIKIDSSNPKFYNSRAQLNYEQKNYALSDADYKAMIKLDQGDVMGYMVLAEMQMLKKDGMMQSANLTM